MPPISTDTNSCSSTSSVPEARSVGPRVVRAARLVSAALALSSIVFVIWVGVARITHPFELEWLEGAMADHVTRLMRGEQIYVPPSVDFVPFIYPPFYYYASAAVAAATGPGLFPMRLVAFLSTLGCFAMIGSIVWRETKDGFAAIVGAGLFAAAFVPGGAWFDLARLDSLFILEILAAAALIRFGRSHVSAVAAGLVMSIALLTKQSAALLGAPLGLYLLIYNRPRAVTLFASFAIPSVVAFLLLNAASDGWYAWYVWEAPTRHSYIWLSLYTFWAWSLFRAFPLASLGAIWYAIASPRRANPQLLFHGLFAIALIGASWLHRVHKGGFENVLLLAYVAIAMLAGLALASLRRLDREAPRVALLVYTAICIQMLMLNYDPRNYVPGPAQRSAWTALVDSAREVRGEVWYPMHGHITTMAGKSIGAHLEAVYAVQMTGATEISDIMRRSIVDALDRRRYAMIVGDRSMEAFSRSEGLDWFLDALHRNYIPTDTITSSDDALMPYTGARTRPEIIYQPR